LRRGNTGAGNSWQLPPPWQLPDSSQWQLESGRTGRGGGGSSRQQQQGHKGPLAYARTELSGSNRIKRRCRKKIILGFCYQNVLFIHTVNFINFTIYLQPYTFFL
jgi:hypothetical protein